jgi:hypothetical protein
LAASPAWGVSRASNMCVPMKALLDKGQSANLMELEITERYHITYNIISTAC